MHENREKGKIGKTLIVNPGAAHEKHFVILNIDEKKGKVKKIKFH